MKRDAGADDVSPRAWVTPRHAKNGSRGGDLARGNTSKRGPGPTRSSPATVIGKLLTLSTQRKKPYWGRCICYSRQKLKQQYYPLNLWHYMATMAH